MITHYQRLLDYIKPDFVHILYKGRIVMTGGPELALDLEGRGYDWIKEQVDRKDWMPMSAVTSTYRTVLRAPCDDRRQWCRAAQSVVA